MGGKLLKKFGLEENRISKDDYFLLVKEVIEILQKFIGLQYRISSIPAYRNKKDFGDMDILIEKSNINFYENIEKYFQVKSIKNGDVYSFPYKGFQVDLIIVNSYIFEVALDYFSYNDLGNFVGRITNSFGLKYGHQGLSYKITEFTIGVSDNSNNIIDEVVLSCSTEKIYNFLGLDYNIFKQGFDELEDVFKFVTTSSYFNAKMYDYEELNHINRVRNKKRSSYKSFLIWLDKNKELFPYKEIKTGKDKLKDIPFICESFPQFNVLLNLSCEKWHDTQIIKSKFNGNLVQQWIKENFNIEVPASKTLGRIILKFKNNFENFENYVLKKDFEEIKKDFLCFYKTIV